MTAATTPRAQGPRPAGQPCVTHPVDFTAPTAEMIGNVPASDLNRRLCELSCLVRTAHALIYCRVRSTSAGDVLEMEDVEAGWAPVYLMEQAKALLDAIENTTELSTTLGGRLGGAA